MTAHRRQLWWTRTILAGWITLAACSFCQGASSTDELGGETGKYNAGGTAPDHLTTTKEGKTLKVTDGTAAPDRPSDQGLVRLTSKSGPTAVFSGRSTKWGCTYTVNGVYVGSGGSGGTGTPTTWTNTFEEQDNPRIIIEINEDGAGDDVILLGQTGTLRVWVLGTTGSVSVTLSANPTGIVSGLPGSVNVTAGDSSPSSVTLIGQSGGQTTITASATVGGQNISDSRTVKVLAFRGKVVPTDNFDGRSHQKLGVGETGRLEVELAPGTTLDDLKPLTWDKTAGVTFSISEVDTDTGTASFTAGRFFEDVTVTLTDKFGNQVAYPISVVPPNSVHQVKAAEGKYPLNMCGAYMALYSYLLPKDVSFWKIEVAEGMCAGVGRESQDYRTGDQHPPWMTTVGVSRGNLATGCLVEGPTPAGAYGTVHPYDFVNMSDRLDIGSGAFEWNIPWKYRVGSSSYLTPFTKLLQKAQYNGQQSITISKGGATTTQTCP